MGKLSASAELAYSDWSFEMDRAVSAMRSASDAISTLGTEMSLFFAQAGIVRDDEGFALPELLSAHSAIADASDGLEMIVQHGRTF